MSDIREDISFMRNMAEQGRRGPIVGGSFLAAAGLVYGTTAFLQWARELGAISLGNIPSLQIWLYSDLIFAALWVVMLLRLRAHVTRGERSAGGSAQSVFGAAWGGSGLGVCVLVGAIALASWRTDTGVLLRVAPLAAFAFYGTAWFVIAMLARRRWMFAVSSLSLTLTLVMPMFSDAYMLPVLGVGLFLTLLVPGLALMRETAR